MRVAIVNDSLFAVDCLRKIVISGGHNVAWIAHNGVEAVAACLIDRPDIILMDLYMPEMNGIEATRQIMSQAACPVLVVTSDVQQHAARTFEAMGQGALDAVNTPQLGLSGDLLGGQELLHKISIIRSLTQDMNVSESANVVRDTKQFQPPAVPLIVIGASSGGPAVLATILSALPETLQAAIIIVQHVDERFADELALWLDEQSKLKVRIAVKGDAPVVGEVLIAKTNDHLVLNSESRISYCSNPVDKVYRPSVDVFFDSIHKHWSGNVIALMLTGMGADGAEGLLKLHSSGVTTLVQNKESCAVYGMPKAAVKLGAADLVITPEEMIDQILSWVGKVWVKV
ncbi:Chemotaxis response regulator protein-glutamate methylesterase CheB [hydrothermal vent metagenome]|uniref:protein-glutamate methylesterase n=1 Tax=hydrothermal vent metagenome TaxID=652676 RepID=A0A3B0ZNI3_9ZZZZ